MKIPRARKDTHHLRDHEQWLIEHGVSKQHADDGGGDLNEDEHDGIAKRDLSLQEERQGNNLKAKAVTINKIQRFYGK